LPTASSVGITFSASNPIARSRCAPTRTSGSSNGVAAAKSESSPRNLCASSAEPSIVVNAISACSISDAILRPATPPATPSAPNASPTLPSVRIVPPANRPTREPVLETARDTPESSSRPNEERSGLTGI
jgi:hypothetical protein